MSGFQSYIIHSFFFYVVYRVLGSDFTTDSANSSQDPFADRVRLFYSFEILFCFRMVLLMFNEMNKLSRL